MDDWICKLCGKIISKTLMHIPSDIDGIQFVVIHHEHPLCRRKFNATLKTKIDLYFQEIEKCYNLLDVHPEK